MAGKVFGIGLNKTGTRSVAHAMRLLGFRVLHKGDDRTSALVDEAAESGAPLLSGIGDQYDAYFDVSAIERRFRALDVQYPGSKFILTTRTLDHWIESRRRHVQANQERASRGEYRGSWLTVDVDGWRREWETHHEMVRHHFTGRAEDLLVLDVTAGEGWERLAPFLERPVPARAFPWENRDGDGTYKKSKGTAIGKARRQLQYLLAKRGR